MIIKVISFFLPGPIIEVFEALNLGQKYTIDFGCPTIGTFRDFFFPYINKVNTKNKFKLALNHQYIM